MSIVTLRFTTQWPYNPASPVIARLTGSPVWSHVVTIIDGLAFEATMLHGCRVVPVSIAMKGVSRYQDMKIEVPDINSAMKWGLYQDGKGYDFAGAFGLPFLMSEDWSDDRKWWCSELCFRQLGEGGLWLLDPAEHKRVTPNDLHQCNYPKSEIVVLKK